MRVIGLCGVARSGKDYFCQFLLEEVKKQGLSAKRYALADPLKEDLSPFLKEKCNIDIFHCSPQNKELVRPILVDYGKIKRVQTEGKYWTKIIEKQIFKDSPDLAIITDIRYCIYKEDECHWLKNEMGGKLVHIRKFSKNFEGNNEYVQAPNEDELTNDPILYKNSDYYIEWPDFSQDFARVFSPSIYVLNFWNWFLDNGAK